MDSRKKLIVNFLAGESPALWVVDNTGPNTAIKRGTAKIKWTTSQGGYTFFLIVNQTRLWTGRSRTVDIFVNKVLTIALSQAAQEPTSKYL